tara:strand:+ start:3818 stop:3991 length:174 start_codon:yes stop_codon:yes gene_type:complete
MIKSKLDKMISKYESDIENLIVMDDYDGGMMAQKKAALKDLKNLKKSIDKSEKSVIV